MLISFMLVMLLKEKDQLQYLMIQHSTNTNSVYRREKQTYFIYSDKLTIVPGV